LRPAPDGRRNRAPAGPTGGYLLAYPLAACLIAFLWRRSGRGFSAALLSAGPATWPFWPAAPCGSPPRTPPVRTAIDLTVLPFLPGDALKIAAAAAMAVSIERLRRQGR